MVKKTKKDSKKSSLPPVQCKGCSLNFIPRDRRQHFHSEKCREEYYQRTYFSGNSSIKVCPQCNHRFKTTKPGRQTYCSPECREASAIKRRESLSASVSAERKTFFGDRFAALEKDGFKCVLCGNDAAGGFKLSVESNGKGGLQTVCNACVEGREFNEDAASKQNSQ